MKNTDFLPFTDKQLKEIDDLGAKITQSLNNTFGRAVAVDYSLDVSNKILYYAHLRFHFIWVDRLMPQLNVLSHEDFAYINITRTKNAYRISFKISGMSVAGVKIVAEDLACAGLIATKPTERQAEEAIKALMHEVAIETVSSLRVIDESAEAVKRESYTDDNYLVHEAFGKFFRSSLYYKEELIKKLNPEMFLPQLNSFFIFLIIDTYLLFFKDNS